MSSKNDSDTKEEELDKLMYGYSTDTNQYEEENRIKIHAAIKGPVLLWGFEDEILVKGSREGLFMRVDLETGKWKKVY